MEITGIAETGKERDVVVKDAVKSVVTKKYLYAKAKQAANEKEVEEIKEKAYLEALTVDEEKELIRIADGIYE